MPGWRQFLVIALALTALPGCTLLGSIPLLGDRLHECVDEHFEDARNRRWAEQAYREVEAAAGQPLCADYKDGFVEGFAHFVFQGGSGDPPPLPPARYRALRYQTIAGYRAIEQWFAGYRHGTATARSGGYRQFVTGPTALGASAVPAPAPAFSWPNVTVHVDPFWFRRDSSCSQSCPQP